MRTLGIALVVLGALILGYGGLSSATGETRTADPTAEEPAVDRPVKIRPVYGGIALVSGLILLASNGRRD